MLIYISLLDYDMYEQRKYMKYGNGTETRYTYSPNRRRLATLSVTSPEWMGIWYDFKRMGW
ncbi:MAG: hypothetical protein J5554_14415 [Paludibacteraceae bacterium]|nr:hypothetical protein [Paludibacteraceae bacterium]